jgi:capsular polysaccharide biosynthesis protein
MGLNKKIEMLVTDSVIDWCNYNSYTYHVLDLGYDMRSVRSHPKNKKLFEQYESCFHENSYLIECEDLEVIVWPFESKDFTTHTIIGRKGQILTNIYQKKYYKALEGTFVSSYNDKVGRIVIDFGKLQDVNYVQEEFCFIGGAPNYGHWLTDILPLALLAKKYRPNNKKYFVGLNSIQHEILNYLNVDNYHTDNHPTKPYRIIFKKAYIFSRPSLSQIQGLITDSFVVSGLKDESFPKSIYLLKTEGNMRVYNESLIINKCSDNEVKVIDVNRASFEEIVKYVYNAEEIYCPYGASLCNLYFSTNAKIFVLVNKRILNSSRVELVDSFYPISGYLNLKMILGKQNKLFQYPLQAFASYSLDEIFNQ